MVVGKGSFLCHLVFVLLDIARRVDFSVQPHEDGKCSNNSNSVISVDPTSAHMVFPRKHSQFGRESVRIFHHTSRHFLKISCFVLPTGMKTEHHMSTSWIYRYYAIGVVATLPVFVWLNGKINSPGNIKKYEDQMAKEAALAHDH
uniref:Uncharacterized protein n=1 Tax=Daphnia magna TaxID=35525 RepID=A0A0P6FSM2_9CRUS